MQLTWGRSWSRWNERAREPLLDVGPAHATSGGVVQERTIPGSGHLPTGLVQSAPRSARGSQGRAQPGVSAPLTAPGILSRTMDVKLAPGDL